MDCHCLQMAPESPELSFYGQSLVDALSAPRDFTYVIDRAYDDAEVPAADNTYCCPNTHPERAPMVNIPNCFYDSKAFLLDGSEVCMREMCQGKVCVVVNVASFCGLTVTEYNQMNDLVEKFPCDKFLILAFPCNQFCFEENAFGEEEILNMLKHVRPGKGFVPKATMFERIDVNGKDALPMFEFLKREIPCPVDDPLYLLKHETFHYWDPLFRYDISGNFEKFLIDQNGRVVKRYSPMYQMKYLEDDICQLLNIKQDNNLEAQETNRRDDDPDIHPSNKGLKRTWDPSEEDTPKDQAKKEKLDDFFDGSERAASGSDFCNMSTSETSKLSLPLLECMCMSKFNHQKHECIVQHKCGEECKAMVDNSQCKPYHVCIRLDDPVLVPANHCAAFEHFKTWRPTSSEPEDYKNLVN